MAKVELKNLVKRFGKVNAVNNLTCSIKNKEFVVLLGPSGCGKTTTLRCIAGLEPLDEGEIIIGGTIVNDLSPKDRNVAMVFQSYALYPHKTVYDNIAFPLEMRKRPKQEIDMRVKKVAQLIHIEELLGRRPRQLSGGQRQRVALGRAIVRNPTVFLMDEPLSNLDAKLRAYMRAELKKLQQELGTTAIYVTHDQVEAMTMADRIVLMNEGELQQYTTPSEIYSRPSNQFVAGFVGTPPMNMIECSLIEKDASLLLDASDFKFRLNRSIVEIITKKATSSEFVLGIRPENMSIHLHKTKSSCKGKLYFLESLGTEHIVNIKMGENILKIKSTGFPSSVKGGELWFTFDKDKIHIFDKRSGKNLI